MTLEEYTALHLNQARNGDANARENILEQAKPFIQGVCAKYCNRSLKWGRDDELSIGIMAFNEAIDRFKEEKKIPFLGFARIVIKSRLADYFRKESRHKYQPLEYQIADQVPVNHETVQAWEIYLHEAEMRERQEEILEFQRELSQYGISVSELVAASPKHRDSRDSLISVASILVEKDLLMEHLLRTGRLPVKE